MSEFFLCVGGSYHTASAVCYINFLAVTPTLTTMSFVLYRLVCLFVRPSVRASHPVHEDGWTDFDEKFHQSLAVWMRRVQTSFGNFRQIFVRKIETSRK